MKSLRIISPVVCLVLISSAALASTPDSTGARKRPYDVLGYKLLLDWRPVFAGQHSIFRGSNDISMTLTDTTSEIVLDASEMHIDSISLNGVALTTVPQPLSDTTLHIALPKLLQTKGTNLDILIHYTRTKDTNDGLYFYPKGTFNGYIYDSADSLYDLPWLGDQDLAYTMSEPHDANKWMPCNDNPYDKSNSEISIIVPSGFSAQSNGDLQSVDTNGDGSLTFHWKSDRPIVTYLMTASASKWIEWRNYYRRISNPKDSVPVIYFAWPADYNGTDTNYRTTNARFAVRNTPRMIETFSRLFGEYPFTKYGQIFVQPFTYGGMEHQSMTTNERWALFGFEDNLIAHELFHQWFGDKTTCETWADIWLNEGFATFGEAVWAESLYGPIAYNYTIQDKANSFFHPSQGQVNNVPIYGPAVDEMFNKDVQTVYSKPGCVLHMLRRVLDDDTLFFNMLRDYSSAYAYTTANTFQFRNFLQERAGSRSPIDLFEFINQWIFQPDWPIYRIAWNQDSTNDLLIRVIQVQTATDHYTMPIHFRVEGETDTTVLTFINNERTQYFTAHVDFPVTNLVFDTSAVIISKEIIVKAPKLSVAGAPSASDGLRLHEVGGFTKFSFEPVVTGEATLRVLDVLGRLVWESPVLAGSTSIGIPERKLASGDYFAVLRDGAREKNGRFQIRK